MRFCQKKRRTPPAIIIVSLIDILIVLLIFMMVTTTFRQQPAIRLELPTTKQPRQGGSEGNLIVTIAKEPPYFYLGPAQVSLEDLKSEFKRRTTQNPDVVLALRADTRAKFNNVLKITEAASTAGIKNHPIAYLKDGITP